ncbi:MAG: hypothetical protein ACRCVT_14890 [Leadbetterella sp.]
MSYLLNLSCTNKNTKDRIDLDHPLLDFLNYPIKEITIKAGSSGVKLFSQELTYTLEKDTMLATMKLKINHDHKIAYSKYSNKQSNQKLSDILSNINLNINHTPTLKDFEISDVDTKKCLDDISLDIWRDQIVSDKNNITNFNCDKIKDLDTLNVKTMLDELSNWYGFAVCGKGNFTIKITNTNKDTLQVTESYAATPNAWNLPWKFKVNGFNFYSYDINFSRFIDSCIPTNFRDKRMFSNKALLLQIADYLYIRNEKNKYEH